jgi:hypothetical protein
VSNTATDAQSVLVELWKKECTSDGKEFAGLVHPMLRSPNISICAEHAIDRHPFFFEVMRHEIGHVLGLHHVENELSVMSASHRWVVVLGRSASGSILHFFTPFDREEFARVNPEFVGRTGCDIIHLKEETHLSAIVPSEGAPHLLWSEREQRTISFASIDPTTGEHSDPMTLSLTSSVAQIFAHPTAGGFVATLADEDGLSQLIVSDDVAEIRPLLVGLDPRSQALISTTRDPERLAIADFEEPKLSLVELAPSGEVVASTIARGRGFLVQGDEQTFLARAIKTSTTSRQVRVSHVVRRDDRLLLSGTVDIVRINVDSSFEAFTHPLIAAAESDGLLLFLAIGRRTAIVRLSNDLEIERWVELEERFYEPAVVETEDRIILAAWRKTEDTYREELFATELDRATLEPRTEWRQISAADLGGGDLSLWFGEGHLLASWGEGFGDLRTRCVPWDAQ